METLINFVRDNQLNIIISLAVVWVLMYLARKQEGKTNNYANNWTSQGFRYYGGMAPAQRLPSLIKKFGHPAVFDGSKGGLAVWTKDELKGTPFIRVEIRDEMIKHSKPIPHVDFLYTWQRLDIPDRLVPGLHKISESISYDSLAKTVRARCHSLIPNVVTHWIVKRYASGELTLDEAVGKYGPMIMELFNQDPYGHKYKQLYSEI
jgi:hypothetical protein